MSLFDLLTLVLSGPDDPIDKANRRFAARAQAQRAAIEKDYVDGTITKKERDSRLKNVRARRVK